MVTLTKRISVYRVVNITLFMLTIFVLFSVEAGAQNWNDCIQVERNNRATGGYTFIHNGCNTKLWIKWFDENYCRSGCADSVPARGKKMVTPMKGQAWWATCEYPKSPKGWSGGRARYKCR